MGSEQSVVFSFGSSQATAEFGFTQISGAVSFCQNIAHQSMTSIKTHYGPRDGRVIPTRTSQNLMNESEFCVFQNIEAELCVLEIARRDFEEEWITIAHQ